MKKLIYLIVLIVALGLIVAGCIPVVPPTEQDETSGLMKGTFGTTIYVDDSNTTGPWDGSMSNPFSTIQAAINDSNTVSGDTIIVAAGSYPENIIIDKSLTVVSGEGPEVTTINAQGVPIAVLINGADTVATFDGFTVDDYDTVGILAGAFRDVLQEVELGEDPIAVHILNNIVMPPTIDEPHNNNIQIGDGTTGTIIGNEVSGAFLESADWSGSGILVAGSSDVLISNNYVHNCEGGIQVLGYAEYRGGPAAEDNLIENNLVENCDAGISVQGNSIDTIIRYNDVLNNDVGINSMAYDISWDHSTPSGTEIHYNNIVGNEDYGVQSVVYWHDTGNVFAEQVDATYNWWGHPGGPRRPAGNSDKISGPKAADQVSENVLYHPWLSGANSVSNIALDQAATASLQTSTATQAVDGDYNTSWNAGDYPTQWIEIDLGKGSTVVGLRLLPGQFPAGDTTHVVLFSNDGGVITELTFSGYTERKQWLETWFDAPFHGVKTLRVTTTYSPSWVAWFEIEVYGWQ